jgi:hypothetical protein
MTTTATAIAPAETLSPAEVSAFHQHGFIGPFTLCEPEEMVRLTPIFQRTLATEPPFSTPAVHNRHLDCPELRELVLRAPIRERAARLLGPDLVLWRTNFFDKPPGAPEIPWHQDWNYWPLDPLVIVSAWIAVDRTTAENACVQLIPGSHRKQLPHIVAPDDMAFREMADTSGVDLSTKVDMELEPGQFFIFNEHTLHHSEANRSQRRRLGLAVRIIPPLVRMLSYDHDRHGSLVMRGVDTLGFNRPAQLVR